MKKNIIIIIFLFIVFLILWFIYHFANQKNNVCFEKSCFDVELAINQQERAKWLMFRENMNQNHWMLFIFDEPWIHRFWMKNTLIPLDIIRIDEEKNVVFISENTQPCIKKKCESINVEQKAKYVLELNAWIVKQINLGIWSNLKINLK